MRVLVIEPDISSQESLQWAFYHEAGIELIFVQTALSAVVHLLQSSFDLVVLDAKIAQEENGFIPQFCENKKQPIPMLFTLDEVQLQHPLLQVLVSKGEYIFKPFSVQDLLYRVRRLCKSSPTTVVLYTPHEDLSQQVQWALASSGIIVWAHDDASTLQHVISEKGAQAVLWDTQAIHSEAQTVFEDLKNKYPTILLSPLSGLSPQQAQLTLQSDDYVSVPFSPIDLETRVKKQLRKASSNEVVAEVFAPIETATDAKKIPFPKQDEMDQLKVALHHEIRNPLTSILIGTQALATQFEDGSTEKNVLNTIEKSSIRIKNVMDSLASNQPLEVQEYVGGVQMLKLPW